MSRTDDVVRYRAVYGYASGWSMRGPTDPEIRKLANEGPGIDFVPAADYDRLRERAEKAERLAEAANHMLWAAGVNAQDEWVNAHDKLAEALAAYRKEYPKEEK